jgi:hypothetical protein
LTDNHSDGKSQALDERLSAAEARKIIRDAAVANRVLYTSHARKRMAERKLDDRDVIRVLRSGVVGEGGRDEAYERWTYPVTVSWATVRVGFTPDRKTVIVTVWRNK